MASEESDPRPEAYFWAEGDEIRRAFIIDVMADADIDGKVLVDNMDAVFHWLKSGKVSRKTNALQRSSGEIQAGAAPLGVKERPEGEKP